jgi:hypothetical protein
MPVGRPQRGFDRFSRDAGPGGGPNNKGPVATAAHGLRSAHVLTSCRFVTCIWSRASLRAARGTSPPPPLPRARPPHGGARLFRGPGASYTAPHPVHTRPQHNNSHNQQLTALPGHQPGGCAERRPAGLAHSGPHPHQQARPPSPLGEGGLEASGNGPAPRARLIFPPSMSPRPGGRASKD